MIKVFPSQLPAEPIEVHEFSGLIADWFKSNGIDFESREDQPITLTVDGVPIPPEQWSTFFVESDDEVEIRLIPHGWEVLLYAVIIAFTVASALSARRSVGQQSNQSQQGRSLDSSSAQANRPMLGSVVPELAGRFRRYPDYLNQPRRYFASEREQILEMHVCIGPGSYQILDEDVKVGDTPFSGLGDDSSYTIYPPGADLSGDPSHINWYNVAEVGGTSAGDAGLELSSDFASDINPIVAPYGFNTNQITIDPDDGVFPSGWGIGTVFSVRFASPYNVTLINTGTVDVPVWVNVFTGNFSNIMPTSLHSTVMLGSRVVYVRSLSVNSFGNGSAQFYELGEGSSQVPVSNYPLGTQSIAIYKTNRRYIVYSYSPNLVSVEAREDGVPVSWPGWDATVTNTAVFSVDVLTIYGDWSNWFRACPNNEKTAAIEVDFFFPQGLAYVNDDGSLSGYNVSSEVQWRDVNGLVDGGNSIFNYSKATADQIGFTERINISSMLPEVRVRRRGVLNPEQRVRNTIQWYGLRSILPTVTSYPNWTTMSARLRTGGKLAAQSENKINVIATRILPELTDDGWSAPVPTRQVAAFANYIGSTISYTDENFDINEMRRLQETYWSPRNETADFIYDQTTVKEALNITFGAGMAEFTISDGQIKPVRDDVRNQREYSYSPLNMTNPLRRKFRAPKHDDPDGVEVEFINEETWAKETIDCLLPGDLGLKKAKIKVDGVTSRTRAWRIGMRYRRDLKFRVWEYNFSTEMDGLNSEYLSFDMLFDDIPGYGQSAIMRSITAYEGKALIESAEPIQWEEGANHVVAYRKPDGILAGPFSAERGIDDYTIIADIPLPWPVISLKQEPPFLHIGTTERWTFPALITEVSPKGTDAVDIKAMNYDVRVYADDNNEPD